MSTHQSSPLSTASQPARLALSLADAGSSGIIDIRNLRSEPLSLSLRESLSQSSPRPPLPHPSPPPRRWWAAIGSAVALSLGMIGLSVALAPTAEAVTEHPGRAQGQLAMLEAVADPGELAAAASPVPTRKATRSRANHDTSTSDDEPAEATPDDVDAAAAEEAEPAPEPEPRSATRRARSRTTSSPRRSPPKDTTASKAKNGSIPVECVLDPSRCDARGSAAKTPATSTSPRPAPLPAKLSLSQLKQALATTKADARRCGPEHGVDPGITVRVKLSIEGTTGSVLSATPLDEHATGSLGRCVARALAQTQFSRFSTGRMGTIYSVRL